MEKDDIIKPKQRKKKPVVQNNTIDKVIIYNINILIEHETINKNNRTR